MAGGARTCPVCGSTVGPDAIVCPACHTLLEPEAPRVAPPTDGSTTPSRPARTTPPAARSPPPPPGLVDLNRRLVRLAQWSEAAEPLGLDVPRLPAWAEEIARTSSTPESWVEVVRGIERLAQRRVVSTFEEWEKKTRARLARLEAYSVDSRLEREQIDEALHAARIGEVAQALATSQQVDRVVALKERHLDQARTELERVVAFLKDIAALGLPVPGDPTELGRHLESELRAGRLAPLKQEIRILRQQTVDQLRSDLHRFVAEYGDFLLDERGRGIATEREATALAQGARDVFQGRPEEGVRRLRQLRQSHGPATGRFAGGAAASRPPGAERRP